MNQKKEHFYHAVAKDWTNWEKNTWLFLKANTILGCRVFPWFRREIRAYFWLTLVWHRWKSTFWDKQFRRMSEWPPVRSVFVHQISNELDRLHGMALILRCWGTSLLVTTLKKKPSSGHGSFSPRNWECRWISFMYLFLRTMMKRMISGRNTLE